MVTLYTLPSCVQCAATYRKMSDRGVEFQVVDLSVNDEALQFVRELGYQQVPVVVAGDRHWSGFVPSEIDALVA